MENRQSKHSQLAIKSNDQITADTLVYEREEYYYKNNSDLNSKEI